ncbi:MAG TPA: hypothetical protein VKU85_20015 [bacterium]|nr:hypothetical protein [bacterium]
MPRGFWSPVLTAAALGAAMIWLAGAPLDRRPASEAALLEPTGRLEKFPRRFAWTEVPTADGYEITVTRVGGEALFRQRGTGTVLELEIDEEAEPPAGAYEWEVVAYGRPGVVARARGAFSVTGEMR